ncbi:MAG TPA: ArsA-related P-loop ATPase [Acidimicrobiales bacterium]|nr:ArsA-related P-loop ATPase [Acidimicrobiales bacterium]
MRVAFVGKGGVGKSAIAGTFARALARRGDPVLALDSDPMPGMAFSLGLERSDAPMPDEAVEERQEGETGPRYRLRTGLSAEEAVERYATLAPDGVRFLQFGKHRGQVGTIIRSQFAFRQIIQELPEERWSLVGDLPGGTRQAFGGWGDYADTVFVVVEPTAKSLLTGRRLARLAGLDKAPGEVVAIANKVRDPGDVELVERRTGLDVVATVGWDEALAEAERQGAAPIDVAPDSPAVRAVESLVDRMCQRQAHEIKERIS